jgi:group I intron endonuclease
MIGGIYKITCRATGEFYIGSSKNLEVRLSDHKSKLKAGKHRNRILQSLYTGDESLEYEILLYCSEDYLIPFEQIFIDNYFPTVNLCPVAGRNSNLIISEEGKKRMSDARKRFFNNGGVIHNKGKKVSEEQKQKISEKLKKHYSENLHPFLGKTHTDEAKELMIAANKRRTGTHHNKKCGKVLKLDPTTKEVLGEYKSTGEAAKSLDSAKGNTKTISNKIRESVKSKIPAYKYNWEFTNNS